MEKLQTLLHQLKALSSYSILPHSSPVQEILALEITGETFEGPEEEPPKKTLAKKIRLNSLSSH